MISYRLKCLSIIIYIAFDLLKLCECSSLGCNSIPKDNGYHKSPPHLHPATSHFPRPNHYRPQRPKAPLKLPKPLGDICWCSKTLLKPAKLSPVASYNEQPMERNVAYQMKQWSRSKSNYHQLNPIGPADPVSQSLAIRQYNAMNVPEAMIAYGFERKPIESVKRRIFSNYDIPEEKLFQLNNRIMVLGKFSSFQGERPLNYGEKPYKKNRMESDEYFEKPYVRQKTQQQSYLQRTSLPPCPTYSMLGFIPENFKNPEFKRLQPYHGPKHRLVIPICKPRYDCECRKSQYNASY